MLEIEISPLALAEADESRAWYDVEQEKLGEEFVSELDKHVKAIQEKPQRYPLYQGKVRRCVMSRFPFHILFDIKPAKIRILRIVHASRDPGPIRELLPDPE